MYNNYGLFIDGEWCKGSSEAIISVLNPATTDVLGEVQAASVEDTQAAIRAAEAGFRVWRETAAWSRADLLHAVADQMVLATEDAARCISLETGKPLVQAQREWALSIDQFRWYAEEARRLYGRIVESRAPGGRIEVHHEPVGVVGAFTAWNFPAVLIARKVAPALAAGCSVIVRPSSEVPGTAMVLFECLRKAGIPKGVVNLVIGPTQNTYNPVLASPVVRKISLTGSTAIGQQMIRDSADTVKRVSMELGGNAPVLVFEDADLEQTLDLCVPTKYANAGQVCVTADRFYVHESLYERFVEGFARRALALKLGSGLEQSTQMGPLINQRRLDAIEAVVADAVERGARLVTGGKRPEHLGAGYFFEPTVLADVPDDAQAMAEENFGPIAAITSFSSTEEAYARANALPVGLSAYAFTRDAARIREVVARLEAGMVGVNSFALAAAEAPFGGIKDSGMGREGGSEGIHDYTNVKLAQITV
ncbi:NAD-dependent succinate-semialdehyde dehydrogenase [Marinobacterium nitratireducens]|nr:NAD-dependent succinate-semialdehyde dehydrogenase [Marinobacterium nitratireducens]